MLRVVVGLLVFGGRQIIIINLQQPLHIQVVLVYGTLLMGQLLWHVNVVNRLDQC